MAKTKTAKIRKTALGETMAVSPTSREEVYARIEQLCHEAQRLETPDECLAMCERERTVYEAMLHGDVLPSPKYALMLTNRDGAKPFDSSEMERYWTIKALQKSFADACPDYLGAIHSGLTMANERIDECKTYHCERLEQAKDMRELARLLEVQDHLFVSLEMVYKYCPKKNVRAQLQDEMLKVQTAYRDGLKEAQEGEDWKTRPYSKLVSLVKQTCDAYVALLNEMYSAKDATLDEYRTDALQETHRLMLKMYTEHSEKLEDIKEDTESLVNKRVKDANRRSENGKRSRNKGDKTADKVARKRRNEAIKKVFVYLENNPNKTITDACRYVCGHFRQDNRTKEWYPYMGKNEKPISHETLQKYVRDSVEKSPGLKEKWGRYFKKK